MNIKICCKDFRYLLQNNHIQLRVTMKPYLVTKEADLLNQKAEIFFIIEKFGKIIYCPLCGKKIEFELPKEKRKIKTIDGDILEV